jgi:hypothetical protein
MKKIRPANRLRLLTDIPAEKRFECEILSL